MKKRKQRQLIQFRDEAGNASGRIAAAKVIFGAAIPIILSFVDKFKDGKLTLWEKISLGFGSLGGVPEIIDAAGELPNEAWKGDSYDPAEIAELVAYVKELLPEDLAENAEKLTLAIMAWLLQTVTMVDLLLEIAGEDDEEQAEQEEVPDGKDTAPEDEE